VANLRSACRVVKRLLSQLLHIFGKIEVVENPPFTKMSGAANRIDYSITAAERVIGRKRLSFAFIGNPKVRRHFCLARR
jgi:hypothetical protein